MEQTSDIGEHRAASLRRHYAGVAAAQMSSEAQAGSLAWPWLTVERALYGAALLVAAFLRLMALGSRPLDNVEASLAVEALNAVRGQPVALQGQPLLVYGNALLFLLLGTGDMVARLLPALAGTAMVCLPYFLRHFLGRTGALAGAFLLAISPLFVFFSTSVSSAVIAMALALGLVVLASHPELRLRPYLVGLAIGLLLLSGPVGIAALALLAVGLAAVSATPRRGVPAGERSTMAGLAAPGFWRRAGIVAAITYALVATGLGTNLRGLQAGLPDGLGAWLGSAGFSSRSAALLVSYEPIVFILAVVMLAWGVARRRTDSFLAAWAAAGLALATVTGRTEPGMVLLAALPLLLLAGELAGALSLRLGETEFRRSFGLQSLILGPWLFLLYLWAGHFSRPNADAMRVLGSTTPAVLLLPIGFIIFLAMGYAIHRLGAHLAGEILALGAVVVLVCFALHSSFNLLQPDLEMPGQLLLPRPTSTDVRTLVRETRDTLDALSFTPGAVPGPAGKQVQVEERYRNPLAWYLRDVEDLRFVPQVSDGAAIVIVSVDSPVPSARYKGRRYQLAFEMQGQPLASGADRLWRWFIYREPPASPRGEAVVMAVRGR